MNKIYFSDRGFPLVFNGESDSPILTVENYSKWYSIYLVSPDGSVREVDFSEYGGKLGLPHEWCDHVPVPALLPKLAEYLKVGYCQESLEMIIGRHLMEVKEYDPEEQEPEQQRKKPGKTFFVSYAYYAVTGVHGFGRASCTTLADFLNVPLFERQIADSNSFDKVIVLNFFETSEEVARSMAAAVERQKCRFCSGSGLSPINSLQSSFSKTCKHCSGTGIV